ncbi:MAG: cation:proton antiporter, partial [Flavobacteriales bacterium]|nr:cation:proton antiporter [Flavobacteriales bacterium]
SAIKPTSPLMEILHILLIILIATRLFGEIVKRFQFPVILGEIIAGVVLGLIIPFFSPQLPFLSDLANDEVFRAVTDLGVFFLMLYAGLELHPDDFRKSSGTALWIAIGGMVIPLAFGLITGIWLFPDSESKPALALFLGTVLAITAVPVAIRLLMDLGKLNSRAGKTIVSAAVIDDVISLLLLAVLTSFIETQTMPGISDLLWILGKIVLFFGLTIAVGIYALPVVNELVFKNALVDEIEIGFLLIVAMAFAWLAEYLGMHFIMGAFIAGLFFMQRNLGEEVFKKVKAKIEGITAGFLAPVFFASIGLNMDLSAIPHIPGVILLLIGIAIAGKFIGTMIPARWLGFSREDILTIGFSMNARGVVSIIIADVALKAGLFNQSGGDVIIDSLFSAVVIMAITTTIITPIALRFILK